jgi:AraC-like DNA-binding protein
MQTSLIPFKNKLGEGQLFKISRFKEKIKKTRPHKHEGYHELIFLTEGQGFHWIETSQFKIEAPELYFMQPGQLHCWQFTAIPKGFVILFREQFFHEVQEISIHRLIKNLDNIVRIPLTQDRSFEFIFEDIFREFNQSTEFSEQIIQGYLRVIFSKILRFSEAEPAISSASDLFHRFRQALDEHCPRLRTVNDYAHLLSISRQKLNAVCRKEAGKSAGTFITEQLVLEAKRYLLHTENSINEIAALLHFNDASYFIRFFKKHEKMTPLQFRARYFQ